MNSAPRPDLSAFMREVEYRVDFKVRSNYPGRWPGARGYGGGFSFHKFERFSNYPDFRRIDILATSRSPLLSEPLTRVHTPLGWTDVIMLADLSLSLSCGFSEPKLYQIAKLATFFGYTAFRFGDRFGFVGFDRRLRPDFYYAPHHAATLGMEIGEALLDFQPSAPSRGLTLKNLESHLPERKSLIILVSDFYLDPNALKTILRSLLRHRIIPIVLRHEKERRWPPGLFGALRLRDSEEGNERVVFFSSRTIKSFEKKAHKNEQEIGRLFRLSSMIPIILDEIRPDRIVEALLGSAR